MRPKEVIVKTMSSLDWHVIKMVKQMRIERKISQLNLSIQMQLAEGVIGKIENPSERAKYNIKHLNSLAKVLDCSPRDLLPEKPFPEDMVRLSFHLTQTASKKKYYELIKEEYIKQPDSGFKVRF